MAEQEQLRTVCAEHYEVIRELGRGGSAVVFLVREKETGDLYAMKTASREAEDGSRTLRAEAALLEKIRHRGIPQFCGELEGRDGYVMEYMEGETLQKILEGGRIFEVAEAAEAGVQICDILACLHSMDPPRIYRDLKPANIIVRGDGTYALVDFGTVRMYREGAAEDTHHLGTEGYAAPEQYGGWEQSDARTDIYGIGAVLHSMIAGKPPLETGLCPIGEVTFGESGGRMEKILLQCCSVSPVMRYKSCRDLEKALRAVLRHSGKAARGRAGKKTAKRSARRGLAEKGDAARKRFAATAWLSLGCFVACGMFAAAASGARAVQYRRQIEAAGMTGDLGEKAAAYREAVLKRPAEPDAYLDFADSVSGDGVITAEETEALDSLCCARGCLEKMKETRPAVYARLEMEIGKRYFAFCEGGKEPARQAWANAAGTRGAPGRVRKVAEAMCEVLEDTWEEEEAAGRAESWLLLMREAAEEAAGGDGNYAAAVCGAAAGEAAVCADRYEAAGAGEARAEVIRNAGELLRMAENGETEVCGRLLENLRTNVNLAERVGKGRCNPHAAQRLALRALNM